jgi:hypothetical protein
LRSFGCLPVRAALWQHLCTRTIQARWDRYKVAAKRRWDKLSEQQPHGTRGNREYLARRVQEAYSLTREEAEHQLSAWQAQVLAEKLQQPGWRP